MLMAYFYFYLNILKVDIMSKSKLTLIIDGNWLFMSRLAVITNRYANDYDLCQGIKSLMIKSINLVLRKFPIIDNIIFVADGGSWRNQIPLPEYLQRESEEGMIVEYKGTRSKSDDINWDLLFSAFEDFISTLQVSGINAYREQYLEGDDWIWWWSTYLNSQNTNCIIWTKDNDLKQLVNIDNNKCFTAWWNNDAGIFIKDFEEEEFDFLFNSSFNENESIWNQLTKYCKDVKKINPKHIIIDKILKGDSSDNILPIILRASKNKESLKKFKISTKDIDYNLNYNNLIDVKIYIHNLINQKNYKNRIYNNKTEKDIIEHFEFNKKLIVLEKNNYPNDILDIFKNYTEYNLNKDLSIAENQINAVSNKLSGILDII